MVPPRAVGIARTSRPHSYSAQHSRRLEEDPGRGCPPQQPRPRAGRLSALAESQHASPPTTVGEEAGGFSGCFLLLDPKPNWAPAGGRVPYSNRRQVGHPSGAHPGPGVQHVVTSATRPFNASRPRSENPQRQWHRDQGDHAIVLLFEGDKGLPVAHSSRPARWVLDRAQSTRIWADVGRPENIPKNETSSNQNNRPRFFFLDRVIQKISFVCPGSRLIEELARSWTSTCPVYHQPQPSNDIHGPAVVPPWPTPRHRSASVGHTGPSKIRNRRPRSSGFAWLRRRRI